MAVGRLVVVSNRVPAISAPTSEKERRSQSVGGLVTALKSALEQRGGVWFGWSGQSTARKPSAAVTTTQIGNISLSTIDLSQDDASLFYGLFANRTLWPLFHNNPARVIIRHDGYRSYRRVNRKFAEALTPRLEDGDTVWVHDYHLLPLGTELRQLGWTGKIGFFLHTPFPPAESFAILPWAGALLEDLLSYDLAGFHTDRYAFNLIDALETELGGSARLNMYTLGRRRLRIASHPIGIDPFAFESWARESEGNSGDEIPRLVGPGQRLVLGVDRLDYTKGIPERLQVFGSMLEHHPNLRGKVTMIQISAPSRSRLPEYTAERERVDQIVGHINGRFSETGWVPVRYLYRSYTQEELAGFYRQADVCLVTPLRDGMNLIAKEFVASQGRNPGVLVLSKFCGAADAMRSALIVNPYDTEETANAIYRGLLMPLAERRERWEALIEGVRHSTAEAWSESFLSDLAAAY